MSLHDLAQQVQSQGRGNDRMLMHVTPREVAGLQAVARAHGGSLTINPQTGLAEAGFLDDLLPSLLPTIAGVALASTGIGAPAAAMLVGGGYGLATGSVEKGLMAGLGAYGGAGIGEGLAANATAPLEQAATTQTATNAAQAGVIPQAPGAGAPGGLSALNSFDTGAVSQAMAPPVPGTPGVDFGISTAGGQTQAPLAFTQQVPAGSTAEAMKTIGSAGNVPTGTPSGYTMGQLKSGYSNTDLGKFAAENYGKIGMAAAPALAQSLEEDPYMPEEYKRDPNALRLSKNFQAYTPTQPNPYYRPTGLGYAMGGMVDPMQNMPNGGLAALQGMRDGYEASQTASGNTPQFNEGGVPKKPAKAKRTGARNLASMDPYEAAMAELNNARAGANMSQMSMPKGGIAELGALPYYTGGTIGAYSDGGQMLKGPGDGMSDSIPARIGKKQPARLADGEFVVPADVVSHLGNGSTDAGAKKLYNMMDRVRKSRTGTKKQGKQIKADNYLKFAEGGDVSASAPASAPLSYGGISTEALMGLADLSALGNMISNTRGPAAMYTSDQALDKIAAARANRPVVEPVMLKQKETPEATAGRFRLVYDQRPYEPSDYNPATHAGNG